MKLSEYGTFYVIFVDTISQDISCKSLSAIRKSDHLALHMYSNGTSKNKFSDVIGVVSKFLPGLNSKPVIQVPIPSEDTARAFDKWKEISEELSRGNNIAFLEPIGPQIFHILDTFQEIFEEIHEINLEIMGLPPEIIQFFREMDAKFFYLLHAAEHAGWKYALAPKDSSGEDLLTFRSLKTNEEFELITMRDPVALVQNLYNEAEDSAANGISLCTNIRKLAKKLEQKSQDYDVYKNTLTTLFDSAEDDDAVSTQIEALLCKFRKEEFE